MSLGDTIGWTATAVFTASYFASGHLALRRIQMAGASLWLGYGVIMQAAPVIGANILVLSAACWAEHRDWRARQSRGATDGGPGGSATTAQAIAEA